MVLIVSITGCLFVFQQEISQVTHPEWYYVKIAASTPALPLSRLQQIAHILQVPVSFFFEGAPTSHGGPSTGGGMSEAPSPAYVSDFLATSDGLSLTKSFMRIKNSKLRRRIVDLVEQIAGEE